MKCRTCKHWTAPERQSEAERQDAVVWLDSTTKYAYGECELAKSVRDEPMHAQTRAYAYDADMYASGLRTMGEFACIQWQSKT